MTAEALMQAILEFPDDDAPRLVYADWLEEHGDAEQAEFIRVQIELATLPPHERRTSLGKRARELLARNEADWVRPIRAHVASWAFRRGFVSAVTLSVDAYMKHTFELVHLTPIQRIEVEDTGSVEIAVSATDLIPKNIAREHLVLPLGNADFQGLRNLLVVAMTDMTDFDLMQRLGCILNRNVATVEAKPEQLEEAINRRYGRNGGKP